MPHLAEFDKIEWLLLRVAQTLIAGLGAAGAAMRLNRTQPALHAQFKRRRALAT
jgi:hypothetical protein